MKFRKATAAVIAAALAMPTTAICAYAEESSSMKAEIQLVKQRIDIPKSYTDFSYTTVSDCGKTKYTFTWKKPNGANDESVAVSITGKVIKGVTYNRFETGEWTPSFAKLSNEELLKKAKALAKKINPTIVDQVNFNDSSLAVSLYGNDAVLRFNRNVNGALVRGQSGRITINKNTGELISYNFTWINGAKFESRDAAIKKSAAKKAFKDLFPVELVYVSSYDYDTKKTTPHLIYRQTDTGFINAFTGQLSAFTDYDYYGDEYDYAFFTNGSVDDAGALTTEESGKVKINQNVVSSADMFAALKSSKVLYIPKTSVITGESVRYDDAMGYYVMDVSFTANNKTFSDLYADSVLTPDTNPLQEADTKPINGSFSVNALTGELLSFSCSASDAGAALDSGTADKLASSAIKKLAGSKASHFTVPELTKSKDDYDGYDPQTAMPFGTARGVTRTYTATRLVNGVKFVDDKITLTVSNTGYVSSYAMTYHSGLTFPSPTKRISEDAAYSSFFNQTSFGQLYRCAYNSVKKKVGSALVYYATDTMNIDAITGKLTKDDGTESIKSGSYDYTDTKGTSYEFYADKLSTYGIELMDKNGRLNPTGMITFGELNTLLSRIGMYYRKDANDQFDNSSKLTRQGAAKVVAGARFGKEACEMRTVFKTKFSDVSAKSKYLGYIAFADASGMITGSGDKFDPTSAFTRGDALMMVYNYLAGK